MYKMLTNNIFSYSVLPFPLQGFYIVHFLFRLVFVILQYWFQFLPNTLSVSWGIYFSFIVHKSVFCQQFPHESARFGKTCLFPTRAVGVNLRGSDSSVIFGVVLLWKCTFSQLICLTRSSGFGKWCPESTWAWQILVTVWCSGLHIIHGQKMAGMLVQTYSKATAFL